MPDSPQPSRTKADAYWRANLKWLALLMSLWFLASCVAGILLVDWLDQFTLPGTRAPLGFWMAQQGSIFIFLIIISVYAVVMNRLDRRYSEPESGGSK